MSAFSKGMIAAVLGAAAQAATAGVVWSGNGHEYEVVLAEGITWTDARAAALALGGGWDLATITSAQEDTFVISLLPTNPADRSHFWIGASDAASEGSFVWVSGEPFSYTNWQSGEPNNSGNEDFLAYDYRGVRQSWAWNDAPDNLGQVYGFARGYVIERAAQGAVPVSGTLPLMGLGLVLAGAAARRRARKAA